MNYLFIAAVPVLIVLGMIGMAVYCFLFSDKSHKGDVHYTHPDKDMPLYNRGHCDSYSAGNFYW